MNTFKRWGSLFVKSCRNNQFLEALGWFEEFVSKLLSVAMIIVIMAILFDLCRLLFISFLGGSDFLSAAQTEIFGAFLSVLIGLELLQNITAYLQKQSFQVELVIVTSLIAVARKIIILDLEKVGGLELIGLSLAIVALSISFWIIRNSSTNLKKGLKIEDKAETQPATQDDSALE